MKIVRFKNMYVSVPLKDGETEMEIEDRLIDAIDNIAEGIVLSYKIETTEEDD